ncbi:hypothetical protein [Streptomyces thermolilacinus]|uniref:hypothetical protein n=1 Tax=Streptomyces thermolilacinus TaxID=285540 RepID=UPI0033E84042
MTALQAAAQRLTHGTNQLTQRLGERATAWVRAGRRDDLEGWRAILGCVVRAALLAGGLWLLWRAVRAVPALMLLLVPVGVAAAWRAGHPQRTPVATAPRPSGEHPVDVDLAAAVRAAAGPHSGAHLTAIAAHLAKTTGRPWDVAAVRAACTAAGITTAQVRMGTGPKAVTTGVRLKDLPASSPAPAVGVVVAGQGAPTHPATATTTAPDDTRREGMRVEHIGVSGRIVYDPADAARHHTIRTH